MTRKTCLYEQHVASGGRMVDFHGWLLPVQYEGILAEHRHCRRSAGLFDTSHMGQILIRTARPEAISRVTTQDASALPVGRGRYGFLLNDAGGILDDTVLIRLGEREYLLVVNAGPAEGNLARVSSHLAGEAEVVSLSAAGWGKLDLQGPASAAVLAPHAAADLASLAYFHALRTRVCGAECILSRTGYTGELGYEIFAPGEAVVEAFSRLAADERVRPAGLGARDSLRLEMGYPLYGQDIDEHTSPLDADLAVFAPAGHEHIGAAALRRQAAAGAGRKLVAFISQARRRAEGGDAICRDGQAVGRVTSAAFSPSLEVSIGMGYVPASLAGAGSQLAVATARGELPVTVCPKPLYMNGTCRMRVV